MAFDVIEYAQAMDIFLTRMVNVPEVVHPDTKPAMERICNLLRIAKVEVLLYENPAMEAKSLGDTAVIYSDKEADGTRIYSNRVLNGKGNVAIYKLYQIAGEEDWNETERDKLKIIAMMMFAFHGRVRVMQLVEELSFKDQQLGIYNIAYFMKYTGKLIGQRKIGNYAACYFNLRRFSVVNQQLGRERGTQVLKTFITDLQAHLSEQEIVCRIGGDNFIVLFLKEHVEYVRDYLKGTGILYDEERKERVKISAYAGYYMIPEECSGPADIMDRVSVALNIAKNVLHSDSVFYDEKVVEQCEHARRIEAIFPKALENEEFLIYYQPKVQLKDYKMNGAEALCRWKHDGRLIPPGEFIPVLEQSNAVCMLDFYMLEHACKDIRRWLDEGRRVVRVSVNLSRRHLGDMDLVQHILEIVDRYRIPHEYIEIELTETTTDVDFTDLREIVSELRNQGICTSVDDFGVGYSSLNLIRESPWNVVKLDRSFLPEGDEKNVHQKKIMLKYLINMIQDMGLECIVEGVETVEQVNLLKEHNCYLVQGFYFDRPLPVEEFEKRLDELDKVPASE